MSIDLPFRQIHLDFHTGPAIPDVGAAFDAEAFASMLDEARVNSVTLFAKCHHGHLYYDTKHESRHPGLAKGHDFLAEQIEACRRRGIRTPIYLSVQCDEYAAINYPQWRVVSHDGKLAGSPLHAGWHILDMSSPYQDYLAEQLAEVLKKFKPVDGIFLDMCWDQPSATKWALDGMLKHGLDPANEGDRGKYAHLVSLQYMARYKKQVDQSKQGKPCAVAFNSRPLSGLVEEKKFLRHVEIEALPTGGWGYMYFPINVRYVRPFGLPYMGMTARFHKSWADFGGIKPEAALFYECAQMIAHGAQCSIGDQLHPRGFLDAASYKLIGSVYRYIESCEPWCKGAKSVSQIAVLRSMESDYHTRPGGAYEGVVRALQQLRQQFDFLPLNADFSGYDAVIVPESIKVDAALAKKLKAFVKAGGGLLVSGSAALDEAGKPILPELGVESHGPSPFSATYIRFDKSIAAGAPATDHVFYDAGLRLTPTRGATTLARVVEPYFDRTWQHFSSHFQTPPDKVSRYAAAIRKGRCVTIAYPIFQAYGTHGNLSFRHLIGQCLAQVLPEPLVKAGGPSFLETTVAKQGKRTIVHLLSFAPVRRTPNLDIVEEATPLRDVPVSVKLAKAPKNVTLQPSGEAIPFKYADGRASVKVSCDSGHTMVVFE
ncbi:MAG: alpha-L-fucosidase [Planctomycetota bacterium]|nr:alpha-L-fucosidase [Planctomycetota bacterium]